jgi:hypothetical protein
MVVGEAMAGQEPHPTVGKKILSIFEVVGSTSGGKCFVDTFFKTGFPIGVGNDDGVMDSPIIVGE